MVDSSESHTLQALKKLKVDCLYKKSTHFNAARRLQKDSKFHRYSLIIGTILASFSTIMNVGIWNKIQGDTTVIQVAVNILGAFGGFLILYTSAFSDYKSKIDLSNKHENIGNDLNLIFKKIRNTEAKYLDKLLTDQQLADSLDSLSQEYISKCDSAPITKDGDYSKARHYFKEGYTTEYTEEELNS